MIDTITEKPKFETSDLSLATYICMQGRKVLELKPTNGRLIFVIDASQDEGNKYQDEFMSSEFISYYNVLRQMKSLIHSYKERRQNEDEK